MSFVKPVQNINFILLAIVFCVVACPGFARGQTERLELGRRLQRFEVAWESATPEQRTECVPAMKSAVNNFFGLQLSAVGRNLDQAWLTVRGIQDIGVLEKFAIGQQLVIEPVFADVFESGLQLRLAPFYLTNASLPDNSRLLLTLEQANRTLVATHEFQLSDLLAGSSWDSGVLPEGDYQLRTELECDGEKFSFPETTVSRIDRLDGRLQALGQSLDGSAGKMDDTVRATIRDSASLLQSMKKGEIQETDYPALARLKMCEEFLKTGRKLGDVIEPLCRQSDVWLSLAKGRSSVPVRMRAPAESDGPMPVLFLFHGAGGSENMFFETYGAGRVVEEGLKRGWLVVAPRQGLFGLPLDVSEMLDVLGQSFEIDRSQVMLLGHSMGAGQVVRQSRLHPEIPAAAVALGGGNRVPDATTLKPITWFIAAGSEDLGKGGAKQVQKSLEAAGVTSTWHEYHDVEHMVIVQAAIDDVFQFLETALLDRNPMKAEK